MISELAMHSRDRESAKLRVRKTEFRLAGALKHFFRFFRPFQSFFDLFGGLGGLRGEKQKLQTEIFRLPSTIPEKDRKSAGKSAGKIFKKAGKSSGHFSGHFQSHRGFRFR